MERLTKTYSDGTHGANDNLPCGENSYTYKGLLLEALGKYEDAEEQDLLLRLPCKIGATVYLIKSDGKIVPRTADMMFLGILLEDYGKEWFLTREEAEQKLKEMENNNKVMNFNDKQVTVAIVGNSEDTAVNLIHKVMNGKYDERNNKETAKRLNKE